MEGTGEYDEYRLTRFSPNEEGLEESGFEFFIPIMQAVGMRSSDEGILLRTLFDLRQCNASSRGKYLTFWSTPAKP